MDYNQFEKNKKPESFSVRSDNYTLVKAFWEDLQKLGYSTKSQRDSPESWLGSNYDDAINSMETFINIHMGSNSHYNPDGKINQFILPADYERALEYCKNAINSEYWSREFLFTSADGVKIYVGDDIWCVNTVDNGVALLPPASKSTGHNNPNNIPRLFSNKGAAEEFSKKLKEQVQLTVGSNNIKVTVTRNLISTVHGTWNIDSLRKIKSYYRSLSEIDNYTVMIPVGLRCIRIGCNHENNLFSLKDLENVISAYEKLQ